MKYLGRFTLATIVLCGIFFGINPASKLFAQQNADSTSFDSCVANGGGVNECRNITNGSPSLLGQGIKIFDDKIIELSTKTDTNQALITRLTKSVNDTKAVFIDAYNNPKPGAWGVPTDPTDIYNQALKAAFDHNFNAERPIFCSSPVADQQGCKFLEAFGLLLSKTVTPNATLGSPTTLTNAQQQASTAINSIKPPSKCGSIITDFLGCLDVGFTWFVKTILLEMAGFLLWMSANLLNYAMQVGIFHFKDFAPNEIYAIWLTIRQVVSLFVFFAGMFIGFMAIIGKSEDFERYIAALIIFGLFVNFSYPVVRVFIDMSNVISLKVYSTALGPSILVDNTNSPNTAGARMMSSLGLQGLVMSATAVPNGQAGVTKFTDQITSTPGALVAVAFVAYSAYIFWLMAALIIIRTVMLVFVIIASPLLLVDTVVPLLGTKAQEFRGVFFSQLMVAPVFTIMLALTLKFLEVFSKTGILKTGNALTGAATASSITVFFNLLVMLIMLHIMLKVTKQAAGGIGEMVTKFANKGAQLGGGLALGLGAAGAGVVGRQGLGRLANAAANSGFVDSLQGSFFGGKLKSGLQGAANSKYDLRNLKTVQGVASTAGLKGMGTGAKTGYVENRAEKEKDISKKAADIKDDYAREAFKERKLHGLSTQLVQGLYNQIGKKLDLPPTQTANMQALNKINKEEDDMLKKYIAASAGEKDKMRSDPANKAFNQRFNNLDALGKENVTQDVKDTIKANLKLSPAVEKALSEKTLRDDATKDRAANYLNADLRTRENLYASSINDEALRKKLDAIDAYRKIDNKATNALQQKMEILKNLGDTALATKVVARDTHTNLDESSAVKQKMELYQGIGATNIEEKAAKEQFAEALARSSGETEVQKAKREAAAAVQKAQVSATEALNSNIAEMIKGQNDLHELLRKNLAPQPGQQPAKQAVPVTP